MSLYKYTIILLVSEECVKRRVHRSAKLIDDPW